MPVRVSGDQIRSVPSSGVEEIHQQGFSEVEEIHQKGFVESQQPVSQAGSQELERPSRSDQAARKSETNLEGQSRQAALDRQLLVGRADAIFKASDGIGTDEQAIFRSLSGLNQKQRTELNEIYRQKFGMSIEDQLKSEMSGPELQQAMALLHGAGQSQDLERTSRNS